MKVLSLILIYCTLTYGLGPKTILKHGITVFIQEITEPTEENLCYNVFIGILEELLIDYR